MSLLSVIIPAFNEEKNIELSYKKIKSILQKSQIDFEMIYVNDGSKDNTWDEITKISIDTRVVGVNFSRNFGKESAIEAGLKVSSGSCAVVIDCDLQHPPETIITMFRLWEEGCEIVEGVKSSRGTESYFYKTFSKLFYKSISKFTNFNMNNSSDFKLLDRTVINQINMLPEKGRFFRALSHWVGFKQTTIEFDVKERINGDSKWSIFTLFKYAISNITSFTSAPLHIITMIGIIYLVFATILGTYSLISYFLGQSLEGFTTVILLLLILGGTIMVSIGILGIYVNKIFEEVKARPNYIISNLLNCEDENHEK